MSHRRLRRRAGKVRRHVASPSDESRVVVRQVEYVEPLAYTRSQAAEALGLSRSTFIRRVLPYVETIETPWGARLIPVDELERLLAERRRAARSPVDRASPGRPPGVPPEMVARIRAKHGNGKSLRRIAAELNADGTPTAHGGRQWWPSTVRAVIVRGN